MICAWIDTSSAETGSSHDQAGSSASARAMPDALALAAGELVRVAHRGSAQAHRSKAAHPRAALGADADRQDAQRLADDVAGVMRGFSEA